MTVYTAVCLIQAHTSEQLKTQFTSGINGAEEFVWKIWENILQSVFFYHFNKFSSTEKIQKIFPFKTYNSIMIREQCKIKFSSSDFLNPGQKVNSDSFLKIWQRMDWQWNFRWSGLHESKSGNYTFRVKSAERIVMEQKESFWN